MTSRCFSCRQAGVCSWEYMTSALQTNITLPALFSKSNVLVKTTKDCFRNFWNHGIWQFHCLVVH